MKKKSAYLFFLFISCFALSGQTQIDTIVTRNIVYAEVGSRKLLLDLYMPANHDKPPRLIIWIHGGAWRSGSKENPPLGLVSGSYALASIDFRMSEEAPLPAMVYDIKAAIRFLRANAMKYHYLPTITIWGSSSGGHLAALVGTTNNDPYWEGDEGNYTKTSSSVQAIIDFFGPTDLLTILSQSTPHGISVREPALKLLLGKPVAEATGLARRASPVFQVDSTDPPLLIMHGDQDNQVPVNQSIELMEAYKKKGLPVQLEFVAGAGHSDKAFGEQATLDIVRKFLYNGGKK